MEAGAEGALGLGGGPAEIDPVAAAGDLVHFEALGFEPGGDLGDVGGSEAETVGELFRGKPLVVVRGGRKLLAGEEGAKGRGGFEEEGGLAEGHVGSDGAHVVGGECLGMDMAFEGLHAGAVHRLGDALLGRGDRAGKRGQKAIGGELT